MIRVLTVAREFGSGGAAISRILADRLGWRLMDREIVDEVVRMAGVDRDAAERCDEQLDPLFHRLLKGLWQGGFETSGTSGGAPPFDSSEMSKCARAVIEQAASQGRCVVVGRGAQCLLGERNDTLHTFIWAPRAWRIERVRQRFPNEKDAGALMDRVDRNRAAFIRREFDADWYDHRLYDLMVNSALGDHAAAACILAAVEETSNTHA